MGKKGAKHENVLSDVSNMPAEAAACRATAHHKAAQQPMITFSRKDGAGRAVRMPFHVVCRVTEQLWC